MQKKKAAEAERVMKEAISLVRIMLLLNSILALFTSSRGLPDAAIKEAQRGILLGGNPLKAYWLLSEAFKEKKDYRTSDHFSSAASRFRLTNRRCP